MSNVILLVKAWFVICGIYVSFSLLNRALARAIDWRERRTDAGRKRLEVAEAVSQARQADAERVIADQKRRDRRAEGSRPFHPR